MITFVVKNGDNIVGKYYAKESTKDEIENSGYTTEIVSLDEIGGLDVNWDKDLANFERQQ